MFQTRKTRVCLKIAIALLSILGLWLFLSAFVHCSPVDKAWKPKLAGHCLDNEILWFAITGVYIVFDLVVIAVPILASHSLYLQRQQKAALCVLFGLGGLYVKGSSSDKQFFGLTILLLSQCPYC